MMVQSGTYYVIFRIERPGFQPFCVQGLYSPSKKMSDAERRIEVYQAIHAQVTAQFKTDRFKMKIVSIQFLPADFVYNAKPAKVNDSSPDR